mgnify:CR=1 FL=1
MPPSKKTPSQLMDLFLGLAAELGISSDRDVAALADVGPEAVPNWRSGAVKEFKAQKFAAAKHNLIALVNALRAQAGQLDGNAASDLAGIEIEEGSSPSDLQRQFHDRVSYDYLGHRFLYFDPQGALAWENLIKAGYEQDCWLAGVAQCADGWLDVRKDASGQAAGPIARALHLDRRDRPRGLDVISLGAGEGGKELVVLRRFLAAEATAKQRCRWVTYAPVDVSIPLLLRAVRAARQTFADAHAGFATRSVLGFCADFEESRLGFMKRLRSSFDGESVRLVLILGNVLGNLRDEGVFVRQKLWQLARPGDLVWIEVGVRPKDMANDPLFALTRGKTETAGETNRRLLIEGPYRRFAAALGRPMPHLEMRVWLREDDESARVPGSVNFCHDLVMKDENRVCTMLYSRRYEMQGLSAWFEGLGFEVMGLAHTHDSQGRDRVGHLLLRRR